MQRQDIEYFLYQLREKTSRKRNTTDREIHRVLSSHNLNTGHTMPYQVLNLIASHIFGKKSFLSNNKNASWDHMCSCLTYVVNTNPQVVSDKHYKIVSDHYLQGYTSELGRFMLECLDLQSYEKPVQPVQAIQTLFR